MNEDAGQNNPPSKEKTRLKLLVQPRRERDHLEPKNE